MIYSEIYVKKSSKEWTNQTSRTLEEGMRGVVGRETQGTCELGGHRRIEALNHLGL